MTDFLAALGLFFVIEGVIYAAFPDAMKRTIQVALTMDSSLLRGVGLTFAFLGLILVWLVRG